MGQTPPLWVKVLHVATTAHRHRERTQRHKRNAEHAGDADATTWHYRTAPHSSGRRQCAQWTESATAPSPTTIDTQLAGALYAMLTLVSEAGVVGVAGAVVALASTVELLVLEGLEELDGIVEEATVVEVVELEATVVETFRLAWVEVVVVLVEGVFDCEFASTVVLVVVALVFPAIEVVVVVEFAPPVVALLVVVFAEPITAEEATNMQSRRLRELIAPLAELR